MSDTFPCSLMYVQYTCSVVQVRFPAIFCFPTDDAEADVVLHEGFFFNGVHEQTHQSGLRLPDDSSL